ncbi:MAG TPA: ATP-binding protein [Steroidobacteraceae bacterium]|nr:ATP-binding protein [Steroidobacteraceae bacterium]
MDPFKPSDPNTQIDLERRVQELEVENDNLRALLARQTGAEGTALDRRRMRGSPARAWQALREEKRTLELLNYTGAALAAELNLDRLVQVVTDAGVRLVGAEYGAFYYTATKEDGEKYMLYAASGFHRDALKGIPLPQSVEDFAPMFKAEGIVRSNDIRVDPRYARHAAMCAVPMGQLAVRSYLALPVISRNGELLGGMFFAHRNPGVFSDRSERALVGIATQAAVAFDNARLFQAAQREIDARTDIEAELRRSEERFRALIEHSTDCITVVDARHRFLYLSPSVSVTEGRACEDLLGTDSFEHTHPYDVPLLEEAMRYLNGQPGKSLPVLWRRRHHDGRWLWLEGVATNLLHDPAVKGIVANYRDVTERKLAADVQTRSQRMEALGTLAGGIAHEFNNFLLAIGGNARLAIADLPDDDPAQESLSEIAKAAGRASDLVRRILAFGRAQEPKHEVLDLRAVVEEALKLLRSTLPALVQMRTRFDPDVPSIVADSTQIHQVIMNLATNAAHAVGRRAGLLEVELDAVNVDADLAATSRDLRIGPYARVRIRDDGCGMSKEVLERIFDPFFTTKPAGQGTGLGLSVVHGIMKGHEGAIAVHSELGNGTTFDLYFPAAKDVAVSRPAPSRGGVKGAGEHVLYVDDDEAIVFLTTRVLKRLGYRVSGYTDVGAALNALKAAPQDFDVVVTDLSMPVMSGFDFAAAVREVRADLAVLMTSGYVRPEDREVARERGIRELILKPNTVEDLGHALDRVLRQMRQRQEPASA